MPPKRGSRRVVDDRGRLKFISPEDAVADEAKEERAAPEQTIALTESQLQQMMENAARSAVAAMSHQQNGERRVYRNTDFQRQAAVKSGQTQEDVERLAAATGGCAHYDGFLPAVPEFVVVRDLSTHARLIGELANHGYVVMPNGVELSARFEPTKDRLLENGKVVRVPDPDRRETPEGRKLLKTLDETELTASRIFIQRFISGRGITGDRQVDDLVSEDSEKAKVNALASMVMSNAEAGLRTGNFGGDDVTALELGSLKGAAAVETLSI